MISFIAMVQKRKIKSTGLAGKIEGCTNGIDALKYPKENVSAAENLQI
jgi:hypothetical protein